MKPLAYLALAALTWGAVLPAAPVAAASATAEAMTGAGAGEDLLDRRRRPRLPGGSGCDSWHDIVEHPECRG